MNVADGENSSAAGLKVRIDGDTAILIQAETQAFKGVFSGEKSDLNDRQRAVDNCSTGQGQTEQIAGKRSRLNLGRNANDSSGVPNAGQSIRLAYGDGFANDEIDGAATSQNHQCRIQRRIAAANDRDT